MESAVLIFPIDVPQTAAFAHAAKQLGHTVVAASSEPIDPGSYPDYVTAYLPYVTDPGFDAAFAVLLDTHRIRTVHASHPAVWWHLQALSQRADFAVPFRVCNESPFDADWQAYGEAYRWAEACADAHLVPEAGPALSVARYAGLFRAYNLIPGQSDNAKLLALAQIARHVPAGDVVEIGSLYGKSAFALAWLAGAHRIGSVISVDPWELAPSSNQGEQARLVNAAVRGLDWQRAFLAFAASLAVFDHVNYVRAPSEQAISAYRDAASAGRLCTEEFGCTPVEGRIALLHVDGNHKYEAVKRDLAIWLPFVQAGGWVLVDDYVWAFGDGPKRAGDELLSEHRVKTAFVAADTLFVQV